MNQNVIYNDLAVIANTVSLNLSYLNSISSSINILESSLQYPLLECMERRLKYPKISLEHKHPAFESKRCDLFWEDESGEKYLMEMKYDKNGKINKDIVLTDIIRLYFAKEEGYNAFFLLCTMFSNLSSQSFLYPTSCNTSTDVLNVTMKPQNKKGTVAHSQLKEWLSKGIKNIELRQSDCRAYENFAGSYKLIDKNKSLPETIQFKTKLIYQTLPNKIIPITHKVEIWEIIKK